MRETLTLAWHTTRLDQRASSLLLGVSPAVAEMIAGMGLQDDLVSTELRDPQGRDVLAAVSQYLDAGVTIREVALSVGIGTARANDLLEGFIDKGVIARHEETSLYRVRHRCFAYWLQNSGRGRPILVESE